MNYETIALYLTLIKKYNITNKNLLMKLEFLVNRELMKHYGKLIAKQIFFVQNDNIISTFTKNYILNNKCKYFNITETEITSLYDLNIAKDENNEDFITDYLSEWDNKIIDYVVSKLKDIQELNIKENYVINPQTLIYEVEYFFRPSLKINCFSNSVDKELIELNKESFFGLL